MGFSYEDAVLRLSELTSGVHNLQQIVDLGEELLGTPVAFSNSAFHHRARSRSYPQFDLDHRNKWLEEHTAQIYYETVLSPMEQMRDSTPYVCAAENTVRRIFCKGFANGKHVGHLTVPEVDIPLEKLDKDVIRAICNSCSTTYAIESVSYAFDSYFLPEVAIIEALYREEYESREEFRLYARQYSFSKYRFYRALYITGEGINNTDFKLALSNVCVLHGIKQWLFGSDNSLIMLVGAEDAENLKDERIVKSIGKTLERFHVVGGGSDTFCDLFQAHRYIIYAKKIVQLFGHRGSMGRLLIQDLCKVELFFYDVRQSISDLETYCAAVILDIYHYDAEKNTEYLDTLYQYLINHLSPTKTAQALFIHKNTVLYRIKRLEELFELDFSDMRLIYKLLLSFSLLNIQKGSS